MVAHDRVVGSSAIGKWSKALGELHRRVGHRSSRSEARERVKRYLAGLLGRVERKKAGKWSRPSGSGTRRASNGC